jgi:hypothetical protein
MLLDPLNFAGFTASVFGLLTVAVFALKFMFPKIKNQNAVKLNPRYIGATAVGLGSYFILGVLIYFAAGGFASRPTAWYELIVPHNPYLWCLFFLFTGIPLLSRRNKNN